jgi:membrane-bound serine protease (ClpP class)
LLGLWLAAIATGFAGQFAAGAQAPHADVVELDSIIHPIAERYLDRALDRAAEEGAVVVVIELDTPGGLLSSTRDIVADLFASTVPVIVYVAPAGSRAASAGTFITAAGHIAAMAPGTNIGAASPISSTGEGIPETLEKKIFEDAAAEMRSIAERRGRPVAPLEATVLEATAYSAQEALDLGIIDLLVDSVPELLEAVDGREVTVRTAQGERTITLETVGIEIRRVKPGLFDRILSFVADPNISFLLLSLGGLGIFVEIVTPGLIFPGVFGVIALLLAFLGIGNLPGNWVGAALILLGFALAVAEVYVAGFGVLGILGIVSFIAGGVVLFGHFGTPSPTFPDIEVSLKVLVPAAVGVSVVGGAWTVAMVQSRRLGKRGSDTPFLVVGLEGVVTKALKPRGTIRVRGESWSAHARDDSPIEKGATVIVREEEGALLTVERPDRSAADTPASSEAGPNG